MENWLDFSRQKDAQSSLRMYSSSCRALMTDAYQWKYVIFAAHNSLQGFMVAALRGSDDFETWKDSDVRAWIKAYDSNQPLPFPRLDFFKSLFSKLFSDATEDQRWEINWLNEQRNQFVHFNTCGFSLCTKTAANCCAQAIKLIGECPQRSRGIFFCDQEEQADFYDALEEAQCCTKILISNKNSTKSL